MSKEIPEGFIDPKKLLRMRRQIERKRRWKKIREKAGSFFGNIAHQMGKQDDAYYMQDDNDPRQDRQ